MSEITVGATSNDLPKTAESVVAVRGGDLHTHHFALTCSSKVIRTYDFAGDLLSLWLQGKGRIMLKKVTIKATFDEPKGRIGVAITPLGASVVNNLSFLTYPNRHFLSSNTMNVGQEEVVELLVPIGMSEQIFPQTGPLPLPQLVISNTKGVSADLTIVLDVEASGPYVYRYEMDWDKSSVSALEGFQRAAVHQTAGPSN
jgi:hypothetical protein